MSWRPDYLGGGFSATFINVTLTGDLDFGAAAVQSLFLGNDDELLFGNTSASPNARILFETKDDNARVLLFVLPEGDANNVPVAVFGDATVLDKDLGFFTGFTVPTVAVVSDDATKAIYMQHNSTAGVLTTTSGDLLLIGNSGQVRINDGNFAVYGSSADVQWGYTPGQTNDAQFLGLSSDSLSLLISTKGFTAVNHDRDAEIDPTFYWFSATNPAVSNNEWGKIQHNRADLVIGTGANTGAGTGATTIDNGISFQPRGVEVARIGGAGGFTLGSATVDAGVFRMIDGAQTGDDEFTITMSGDGAGDVSLATDDGSMSLAPSDGLLFFPASTGVGAPRFFIRSAANLAAQFELGEVTASTLRFRADHLNDQGVLSVADAVGNQLILTNATGDANDHDHAPTTDPTLFIHSDLPPDTSNNQWGSFHHDQEGFVITTGANVGAGTGATTDDNYIILAPRGTEALRIEGAGRARFSGLVSYGAVASVTIASGVIAITKSYHTLVVEGGAGSGADALTSATGGAEGDVLVLKTTTSGANDTVTVTNGTGAGTFILAGGADFVMDHIDDRIEFLHNGVEWVETSRSDNS